jgi:spermidine synthase
MDRDGRIGDGEGGFAPAGSLLVAAMGFFSIAAQALLFRGFLASFDGSEFGIGSFFGSWLGAVALGAVAGRAAFRRGAPRGVAVAHLTLLYLPAFLLQFFLIADVRRLAGVAPHEAFPLGAMAVSSLLVNAPVGLVTGFLFTQACRLAPVARVYVLEALGGFAGGAAVTLLLRAGASAETSFLAAALPLAAAAALCSRGIPAVTVSLVLAGLLAGGAGRRWAEANDRTAWGRLLPVESFRGSFSTAQGRYLHGEREGDFLAVSGGGVVESLPGRDRASEVVAIHLAQKPDARRVMVAGEGALAAGLRFAEVPQVGRVAWLHADPDFPRALREALPERFRAAMARIEIPGRDARAFAADSPGAFDLILLDLPDVETLVLNRYATREFFGALKGALAPGGAVSVRISGGANVLSGERALLGASMLANLESVFARTVLKPGDESWILASDGEGLETSPALLRDRFAAVPGAAALYPPAGVMALYPPDRIAAQEGRYRRLIAENDASLLVNTDRRPKALLFGLAASLRRSGVPAARALPVLTGALFPVAAAGIVLFGLLRLLFLLRLRAPAAAPSVFDAAVLAFTSGAAGMILGVVLLFLYQARHGSLSFDVGLLSALFMLGLALGGRLSERLKASGYGLAAGLAGSAVTFFLVDRLPDDASRAAFAALFALSGVSMGAFFPAAARRMREAGRDSAAAGAALEAADHWGGAAGAVGGALLLLPACGTGPALAVAALLVGVNLVAALAPRRETPPGTEDAFDRAVRPAAYWMLGSAAFLLAASQIAAWAGAGDEGRRLESAARELASPAELQGRTATLRDGRTFPYFAVAGGGHVFRTRPLAPGISGFGGPIDLAVHVDAGGVLLGLRVLESRETPAYLKSTEEWRRKLEGRNLFAAGAFEGVDAVTGATVSADAIRAALDAAGRAFASEVLGRPAVGAAGGRSGVPGVRFFVLAALAAGALGIRFYPGRRSRRIILGVLFVVAGVWLNLQYSTMQVFSVLGLALPGPGFTEAFFLAAVVPALVLLFGNVYCGWMCPFGALQELAGEGRGGAPGMGAWRWGRSVKYVLLALLAAAFALTRDPAVLAADPLTAFFVIFRRGIEDGWVFGFGAAAVALSFFFRRFWCRNLCPAGAFLSLLAGIGLLRRFLPAERPARCDLGVRSRADLDCLGCDRCRHEKD